MLTGCSNHVGMTARSWVSLTYSQNCDCMFSWHVSSRFYIYPKYAITSSDLAPFVSSVIARIYFFETPCMFYDGNKRSIINIVIEFPVFHDFRYEIQNCLSKSLEPLPTCKIAVFFFFLEYVSILRNVELRTQAANYDNRLQLVLKTENKTN